MNNGFKLVLTFAFGAAAGAVVTHLLIKEKYEKLANEEIEEVRALYLEKMAAMDDSSEELTENDDSRTPDPEASLKKADDIINEQGYINYSKMKGGSEPMSTKPYIISPDDYGQEDDYDMESLVYYADGVLTDDHDHVIEDVSRMVGDEFADHFGEYEADTVFVRNDKFQCDYEICRDERNWSELIDN